MATSQPYKNREYLDRAIDVSINVGLLIVLTMVCYLILRPFLLLVVWGIIIAIAIYPAYRKITKLLGGRGTFAAVTVTIVMLAILIVPSILLTGTLVEGAQSVTAQLKNGTLAIPAPPPSVRNWPLIGAPISGAWELASSNLTAAVEKFAPQMRAAIPGILAFSAGIGLSVVQFVLAVLVTGVLLANASTGAKVARSLADRIFGSRGEEFEELAGSTIRSVTSGIVGVALIQTVFASMGFLAVGLPGAGLWAVAFLIAAVLQVGAIMLIPAVIYAFAITTTTKAVVFLIWCGVVGLMDNVLKPILLGRGARVPIAVVFLGAIGGFMSMGLIGLFVGAIVLSVGYKLVLAWLGATPVEQEAS
jgi:predicted PurR-regulated permease PerM